VVAYSTESRWCSAHLRSEASGTRRATSGRGELVVHARRNGGVHLPCDEVVML